MNLQLLQPAVRAYLMEHIHDNAASFLLKSHSFQDITSQELTQQLIGLQKARLKFPLFFENDQIIFPPKVNLEQTSSWTTAMYKASLFNGENMVDLTGGFGIDISAFAQVFKNSTHIELDPKLQELAMQSFKAQGLSLIHI